ncbi:MAG: hypothetical protein K2N72_01255 [Oscillospiraceae bacterium]|nr:hypothetical protein [Oscillospiraceae bacterium]
MKNKTLKKIAALAAAFAMLTAGTQAITPYTGQEYAITASAAAYGFTEDMTDAERVALAAEMIENESFPTSEYGSYDGVGISVDDSNDDIETIPEYIVNKYMIDDLLLRDSGVELSVRFIDYNVYFEDPEEAAGKDVIYDYTVEITVSCGNASQTVEKFGKNTRSSAHVWFRDNALSDLKALIDNYNYTNNVTDKELEQLTESFKTLFANKYAASYRILWGETYCDELVPATQDSEGSVNIKSSVILTNDDLTDIGNYVYKYTAVIPKLPKEYDNDVSIAPPVIADGAPAANIELPAGTSVEGLINISELEESEKEALDNGEPVQMSISSASAQISDEAAAKLEQTAMGKGYNVGEIVDLTLMRKIGGNETKPTASLNSNIKVSVEIPESMRGTPEGFKREYTIFHLISNEPVQVFCTFNAADNTLSFFTSSFSPYAIAYRDVPEVTEPEPTPAPAPTTYQVNVTGGNAIVTGSRTEGSVMAVTVPVGYEAVVTSGGNRLAVITDGTGTFIMPASDVTIKVDLSVTAAQMLHYPNSYIFSYDSGMNHILTNSSRYGINGTGDVTVKLGADYAGRSVTLYSGRKSTSNKVDEGVLDSSGRITFNVQGGKNFTLIVE